MNVSDLIIPSFLGHRLVGISATAHSGKDTVCGFLQTRLGKAFVRKESFADPLKHACATALGIDSDDFYVEQRKELKNFYWDKSPREILQLIGSEGFRDLIDKNVWIKRFHGLVTAQLNNYEPSNNGSFETGITSRGKIFVIPDVRFQNELDYIYQNGGWVIRLTRQGVKNETVGIANHQSENISSLNYAYDRTYRINNDGTLDDLSVKVAEFIKAADLYTNWCA